MIERVVPRDLGGQAFEALGGFGFGHGSGNRKGGKVKKTSSVDAEHARDDAEAGLVHRFAGR